MKNSKGESIDGIRRLKKDEYGTGEVDEDGQPIVDWAKFRGIDEDDRGFDMTNKESNGEYTMQVELPPGTIIIRYGGEGGQYTAPRGTKYEMLGLPYTEESEEYNEYRVNERVLCEVEKGKVAPKFDSSGGAIQYYHSMTIRQSVRRGILERL